MRWKILNKSISEKELALWLHLTNIPGIGPVKGANILQHAPVTQISPQLLNDAGWSPGRDHTLLMKFEQPDRL